MLSHFKKHEYTSVDANVQGLSLLSILDINGIRFEFIELFLYASDYETSEKFNLMIKTLYRS